jgi:hypothetical protein
MVFCCETPLSTASMEENCTVCSHVCHCSDNTCKKYVDNLSAPRVYVGIEEKLDIEKYRADYSDVRYVVVKPQETPINIEVPRPHMHTRKSTITYTTTYATYQRNPCVCEFCQCGRMNSMRVIRRKRGLCECTFL